MKHEKNTPVRCLRALAAVLLLSLLGACASVDHPDPQDPLESYNRAMFAFNDEFDAKLMRPVARGYNRVLPKPVRTGVSNFFDNLQDAWSFVNNVLQARPEEALSSFWRVVINTTIGLGGVLDPATEMRLERYNADFGLTLGRWGVPSGPYLVLPFLGPSNVRDTVGLPVDWWAHPINQTVEGNSARLSIQAVRFINMRARLLGASDLMDTIALDRYVFMRDAFMQRRLNEVYDGDPPRQEEERWDLDD